MKTSDFTLSITSSKLKESLNKKFSTNVDIEKYSREQLEDIRNKLRTRIFQQEGTAGINDLLTNETYQKDKAMLQLLNTRIKEMLGEDIKKLKDKMVELSEAKKGVLAPKFKKHAKGSKGTADDKTGDGKVNFDDIQVARMTAGGVPKKKAIAKATSDQFKEGFDEMEKDVKDRAHDTASMKPGETKTSSTGGTITKTKTGLTHKAGKQYGGSEAPATPDSDKKLMKKTKAKVAEAEEKCEECGMYESKCKCESTPAKSAKKESAFRKNVKMVNEGLFRFLKEDEEGKAKAITAAGDMVNDYTSWMQRVGQYQTKSMIELADAIRADFGAQQAETFKQAVGPALAATLEVLTQQREAISNAVAVLAGEETVSTPMGMEPEAPAAAPDEMNAEPAADEFAATDAAAGAGTPGREMRESQFARKLAESHSIIAKLAK